MRSGVFSDLQRRLSSSIVGIAVVTCLIYFSYHVWLKYFFALAIFALSAIAAWEYIRLAHVKGFHLRKTLILALTVLEAIAFFFSSLWTEFSYAPLIVFFGALLLFFLFHFNQTKEALPEIAISTFSLLYIALPLGMLFSILYQLSWQNYQDGRWWIAYLIIVTKITDVGAYFFGKLLGKRKLAVSISPRKTIEGALGGFLCAILASFCFSRFSGVSFTLGTSTALILGALLGVVGQIGDLSESLFKRDAQLKDSNTLPGLGGVLDTIDSLILNIPIIYFFLASTEIGS